MSANPTERHWWCASISIVHESTITELTHDYLSVCCNHNGINSIHIAFPVCQNEHISHICYDGTVLLETSLPTTLTLIDQSLISLSGKHTDFQEVCIVNVIGKLAVGYSLINSLLPLLFQLGHKYLSMETDIIHWNEKFWFRPDVCLNKCSVHSPGLVPLSPWSCYRLLTGGTSVQSAGGSTMTTDLGCHWKSIVTILLNNSGQFQVNIFKSNHDGLVGSAPWIIVNITKKIPNQSQHLLALIYFGRAHHTSRCWCSR